MKNTLFTHHHGMHGEKFPVESCIYRATIDDLVEALEGAGAKRLESKLMRTVRSHDVTRGIPVDVHGSYLVFPLKWGDS